VGPEKEALILDCGRIFRGGEKSHPYWGGSSLGRGGGGVGGGGGEVLGGN